MSESLNHIGLKNVGKQWISFILTLLVLMSFTVATAQTERSLYLKEREKVISYNELNAGGSFSLSFTEFPYWVSRRVKSARVYVMFNMEKTNSIYEFGEAGDFTFSYSVDFDLEAWGTGNFGNSTSIDGVFAKDLGTQLLSIDNANPQMIFYQDITEGITGKGMDEVKINIGGFNPNLPGGMDQALKDELNLQHLQLKFKVEIEYGIDILNQTNPNLSRPVEQISTEQIGRRIKLSWQDQLPLIHYQVQMMRVYNEDFEDHSVVKATFTEQSWNEHAVPLDIFLNDFEYNIYSSYQSKSIDIPLLEGSGFYIWRIRPVGNYYEGGSGNVKNVGQWSSFGVALNTGQQVVLDDLVSDPGIFEFEDPDHNLNRIYSRVSAEDGKSKETSVYADGLQNVRQSSVYMPSDNSTIITHTLQDVHGRNAFSTLPSVVPGDPGFIENAVKTSDGAIYSILDFADGRPGKEYIPSQMDDVSPYNYYNEVFNSDPRIPNANGRGFTGQIFYEDPLGRVKESYGPGTAFTPKSSSSTEESRTLRYSYGIPSETELMRVFGIETPRTSSIQKTTITDQNNVVTIQYTNLSGQVLATAMYFGEGDNTLIDNVTTQSENLIVFRTDENTNDGNAVLSSVNGIDLIGSEDLTVDYYLKKDDLINACPLLNGGCNFELDVHVINKLDNSLTDLIKDGQGNDVNLILNEAIPQNLPGVTVDYNYTDGSGTEFIHVSFAAENLGKGSYLVQKKLMVSSTVIDQQLEAVQLDMENQIKPMVDLIFYYLEGACEDASGRNYYENLEFLKDKLNEASVPTFAEMEWPSFMNDFYTNEFVANFDKYTLELVNESVDIMGVTTYNPVTFGEKAEYGTLHTGCCEFTFKLSDFFRLKLFPIDMDPTKSGTSSSEMEVYGIDNLFQVDANYDIEDAEARFAEGNTDYLPDFEGYAEYFFRDCPDLKDGEWYNYMAGWKIPEAGPGVFNLMIQHMLGDQVSCSAASKENLDACGNVSTSNASYNANDLFLCWKSQLEYLKSMTSCGGNVFADFENDDFNQDPISAINANDEIGGQLEKNFDKIRYHKNGLVNWWTKRKVKKNGGVTQKIIDKFKNQDDLFSDYLSTVGPSYDANGDLKIEYNLVYGFLECTGYAFQKILTPYDPLPLEGDYNAAIINNLGVNGVIDNYHSYNDGTNNAVDGNKQYMKYDFDGHGVSLSTYFGSSSAYKNTNDYYYVPLNNWRATLYIDAEHDYSNLFQRIKNPIYAYKYFEYAEEGYEDYALDEAVNCYSDPNFCYEIVDDGGINRAEILTETFTDVKKYNFKFHPCSYDVSPPNPIMVNDLAYYDAEYEGPDGNAGYHRVNNFYNIGRYRCAQTHEDWTCGQIETFYLYLNNSRYPVSTIGVEEVASSCDELNDRQRWFQVSTVEHPTVAQSSIDAILNFFGSIVNGDELDHILDALNVISPALDYNQWATYLFESTPPIVQELKADFVLSETDYGGYLNGDYSPSKIEETGIGVSGTMIMLDAAQSDCDAKCQSLDISGQVEEMLKNKGYDKNLMDGSPTLRKTYKQADVDLIETAIRDECIAQCGQLDSYSCEENVPYRFVYENKFDRGATGTSSILYYLGNGDYPDNGSGYVDGPDGSASLTIQSFGDFDLKKIDGLAGYPQDYSWYDYSLLEQVLDWNLDIDIQSRNTEEEFYTNELLPNAIYDDPENADDIMYLEEGGIANFKEGDWIRFKDVDVSTLGTDNTALLNVIGTSLPPGTTIQLIAYNHAGTGNPTVADITGASGTVVSTFTIDENISSEFEYTTNVLVDLPLDRYDIYLVPTSSGTNGSFYVTDFSFINYDEQGGFTQTTLFDFGNVSASTYVNIKALEEEASSGIPDINDPAFYEGHISPAKTLIVQ